ncbi:MAG: beta-lactamase family protein [Vicinamibacteria bacterium]|nr:beta-lactamase family protein [Vicinamibacteria bacterium]
MNRGESDFRADAVDELDGILVDGVARGAFPGAVIALGRRRSIAHLASFGKLTYEPEATQVRGDTLYDLASLTKVVATATIAMILVDDGVIDLESPVCRYLRGLRRRISERVTVARLLSHSSGLPAWRPLYREVSGRQAYIDRICAIDLEYEPGARSIYSDLGFILLGAVIEAAAGVDFESLMRERVCEPLGMHDTLYLPNDARRINIAPTERDPWRGRILRGEAHDENAFAMGGVAPHAGIFGTAGDLARFARMMLGRGRFEGKRFISEEVVARFTRRADVPGSTFALGWDTPDRGGGYSTAGALFSAESFGHVGFTGTSLWIDPMRDLFLVLLTNRVHPDRSNEKIREIRPAVADAAVRALI